jgi:hypothetical protein
MRREEIDGNVAIVSRNKFVEFQYIQNQHYTCISV